MCAIAHLIEKRMNCATFGRERKIGGIEQKKKEIWSLVTHIFWFLDLGAVFEELLTLCRNEFKA